MSTTRKVMRGEVYYIKNFPTVGHEQRSGRPAVIVSNDENNANAGTYEICYMTLKDKPKLPTHVFVDKGPCINSTILCEQITTVSEEKLGDFMCRIPEHLDSELDKALAISLHLTTERAKCAISTRGNIAYQATPQVVMDELTALKNENVALRHELDLAKDANTTIKEKNIAIRSELDSANAKAEMYERMYNDLLDRLVKRG